MSAPIAAPVEELARTPAGGVSAAGAAPSAEEFRKMYDEHFSAVWHTLRRFGVYERELEDAAHEVFLVLYRRWADFDPTRAVRPWLVGIAHRVASDFRKRAVNRREVVSEEMEPATTPPGGVRAPSADQLVERAQAKDLVHQALATLDDDKRTVFVLVELEGLSVPECEEILGVGLNTLYSRLRLARTRFAAAVHEIRAAAGQPAVAAGGAS